MKKSALYSSAHRPGKGGAANPEKAERPAEPATATPAAPQSPDTSPRRGGPAGFLQRHDRALLFLAALGCALGLLLARDAFRPKGVALTQ
ncbi:MAG TPA: hypothetical protein PLR35_11745, partial [Burkholderiaceae bacterium]|nr:hypothetical protein [Burkholderiaceae bacterium]